MKATVHGVVVDGILQLKLSVSDQALEKALTARHQMPVVTPHMTLVRLDELGTTVTPAELPPPPQHIDLEPDTFLVATGLKIACYFIATAEMQVKLREYALKCAAVLGLDPSAVDPKRVYHVTVSNAGYGQVRASVGAPWEYPRQVL